MKKIIYTLGLLLIANFAFVACDRTSTEGTLTKNFTFGVLDWSQIYPADRVAAAGQNRDVGRININSDGQSFQNMRSQHVRNSIAPAFEAANDKATGNNTVLRDIRFDRDAYNKKTYQAMQDSLLFVRKGFRVNPR